MVTFTRKASEEMKERLKNILNVEELKTVVTTFHSFCARLIFKYKALFEVDNLNIMEEGEREKIFLKIVRGLNSIKNTKENFMILKSYQID